MYLQQKLVIKTSERKSYQARKIFSYKVEEGEKEILKDGSDLLTSAQAINSQKDDFHQIQASLSKVYLVLL